MQITISKIFKKKNGENLSAGTSIRMDLAFLHETFLGVCLSDFFPILNPRMTSQNISITFHDTL